MKTRIFVILAVACLLGGLTVADVPSHLQLFIWNETGPGQGHALLPTLGAGFSLSPDGKTLTVVSPAPINSVTVTMTSPGSPPSGSVSGGILTLSIPYPKTRLYHAALTWDSTRNGWPLPAGATNLVVFDNGLAMDPNGDYQATTDTQGPIVKPIATAGTMQPDAQVRVDYDPPA